MSLRNRLLALSLLTLLLPWSGWKLLQELERFLREAQESSLLATARTLAATLPYEQLSQLQYLPAQYVVLRQLPRAPELDGYSDDWPQVEHGLEMLSADGLLSLRLLAATAGSSLHLLFEVRSQHSLNHPGNLAGHGIEILLRSPRGLQRFDIRPEAPGPLQLRGEVSQGQDAVRSEGQAEGYWLETAEGYRLELSFPGQARLADFQFNLQYPDDAGAIAWLRSGSGSSRSGWLPLVAPWPEISRSLAGTTPEATQAWLLDRHG